MEKDRRIIELLLVLIFVGILLIASVIVIKDNKKEVQQTAPKVIVNNYDSYENYNTEYNIVNNANILPSTHYYTKEEHSNYLDYKEYSDQDRREDFLGTYVQEYYVYVLNKERAGRYFTVTFKLEDKNGYEDIESVTQYIRAGEKEKFSYKDIQFERNEIVDWSYEIIPEKR
jgi:competence protein ComGC